ncbi:hypothetical protein BCON_0600g00020 [Botryotinia convoluta]|uniref:Major facilitator superfamily (MFS) profile domain-containing protein n=1 Tax=Botryotinia convoluta TaxID=54673 RepID=A0A4Z1H5R4_9HELO|nr:hypothetical protein BCON_0600g00020 [Botryotinia convoluta]
MSSPISANIYFPCVPLLQHGTNVSLQLINTTIIADLIIQGIAPAFLGGLLDGLGRRPVYLICFTSYIAASIGLALQDSYDSLLVVRMLQNVVASAPSAIGYGIVSDIATSAERGRMLDPAMLLE